MTAMDISGDPTAEETAAIVAAVELLWPRTVVLSAVPAAKAAPWRFSGRWWSKPVAARRDRPWI
jgi:hypothetical protein